jgi:hypothetical protein
MKTNNKKVEDKFYGKRVVKGIFAKAMFNFRDVGDAHQKAIAIKTLKHPSLALLGGPTAEEAESILRKKFKYTDKQIAELKKYESSRTGSKSKFAVVGSKGNKTAIVIRNGPDADASWIAYVVQDYKTSNEDVIGNMRHYSTEARAKAAALRGLETSGLRASRQGFKDTMASQLRKQQPYETLYYKWFQGVQISIMDMSKIKNEINAIIASGANPEIEMPKLVKKYGVFSRTGSKAKFADDGRAKALVILQQLGGNMFVAMTGAKNLSTESNPPALSMKVGTGAQNKVKHLKVVLDEGSDTYTMIFFDSKGSTIKKLDHVYAEDLRRIFTEVTGFYTSLTRHSRTGVKAKFAFNLNKKVTYLNSENYPQSYKVTDALFAKLNLRDGNSRKYLEIALKTGEAVKISRVEAIS